MSTLSKFIEIREETTNAIVPSTVGEEVDCTFSTLQVYPAQKVLAMSVASIYTRQY